MTCYNVCTYPYAHCKVEESWHETCSEVPFTYFVRVPEGFAFKAASASDGGTVEAKMRDDGLLAVAVSAPSSQNVKAVLQF